MDIFRSVYCSWYFLHYINDISMQSLCGKVFPVISRWQELKLIIVKARTFILLCKKYIRWTSSVNWGRATLDTAGRLYLDKKCKTFIVTNESARQYLSSATGESRNSFKNNLILLSVSPTGLKYNLIFYNRRKPELCSLSFTLIL